MQKFLPKRKVHNQRSKTIQKTNKKQKPKFQSPRSKLLQITKIKFEIHPNPVKKDVEAKIQNLNQRPICLSQGPQELSTFCPSRPCSSSFDPEMLGKNG